MNWTIEHIEQDDYVLIEAEGYFTEDGNRRMLEDLIRQPYWTSGINILLDKRQRDYSEDGLEYMRKMSQNFLKFNSSIGSGKIALLVKSVEDFELARKFEMLTDEKIDADVRVFLSEMLAVSWLKRI